MHSIVDSALGDLCCLAKEACSCMCQLADKAHNGLKTLFNIVEAPFKNCCTLMSVLYDDVQMDQ